MARRQSIYGKKKSVFLRTVVGITIISGLATGLLSISMVLMNINIYRSEQAVNQTNNNMASLETELKNIKDEENKYKNQAETLQQQLSQYQPVVIPDSMKQAKAK